MNHDRMYRGDAPRLMSDADPRQAQRTFEMEKIMQPFIHHHDCGCERCRPAPVGAADSKMILPLVIFLSIMALALFAGTVAHLLLD